MQDAGKGWQIYGKRLSEKGGYITMNSDAPLTSLNQSVKYLEAALRLDPKNASTIQALVETKEAIGRIDAQANPTKGMQDFSDALSLIAQAPESDRQSVEMQQIRARLLDLLGWGLGQMGDFKGSLARLEEARPIVDAQAAADPSNLGTGFRRMDLYRSIGLVEGYAGHPKESLEYLETSTKILDDLVRRDAANRTYPVLLAEMQGRVANLLVEAGRKPDAEPYARASVAYFRTLGERPDATPSQLMECVRSLAEIGVPALRDYPAALRFAQRANQLAEGKNPGVLGYLAEAYALNKNYSKAAESAERGLGDMGPTKPGEPPSRLRGWLRQEAGEYKAKAR